MNTEKFLIPFLLVLTAVALCYWYVDVPVALYLSHHPVFNAFLHGFSILGESQYYFAGAIVLIMLFRNANRITAYKASFVLISLVIGSILAAVVKVVAGRTRPELYFNDSVYGFLEWHMDKLYHSFPSSHATIAFAFFMALVFIFPRQKTIWIGLAVLAALSRVVMLKHFVSDVVAGAFIGTVSAYISYYGYYRLPKRKKESYGLHRLIFSGR